MTKLSRKLQTQKRHRRLRRFLIGDATRPRLSVFRSNNHIYAQVIDDSAQTTICSASTVDKELREKSEKLPSDCNSSSISFAIVITIILFLFARYGSRNVISLGLSFLFCWSVSHSKKLRVRILGQLHEQRLQVPLLYRDINYLHGQKLLA